MAIEKALVLEADAASCEAVVQMLQQQDVAVTSATSFATARELLGKERFDLVLANIALADGKLESFMDELQMRRDVPALVILSASSSLDALSSCLSKGAFDVLVTPFSPAQLAWTMRKTSHALQLSRVSQYLSRNPTVAAGPVLLGNSALVEQLRGAVRQVAPSQATVLVQGPRGAGQQQVAAAICAQSTRNVPFIRFDCAACAGSEEGVSSQALTVAMTCARGGTILLDNVELLPMSAQNSLLQIIQTGQLPTSSRPFPMEARIIATAQIDLAEAVKRGEFREDLFHALNILPVRVPSLRERAEDIPALVEHFRAAYARKLGFQSLSIAPASLAQLRQYNWPGNLRELAAVLERAALLTGEAIEPEHLCLGSRANLPESDQVGIALPKLETVDELERRHILHVLAQCRGSRTRAAEILGISIRTLRNKLKEYRTEGMVAEAA